MADTYRDAQRRAVLPPIAKPRKAIADDSPFLIHAEIDELLFAFWEREHGVHFANNRRENPAAYVQEWGVTFHNLLNDECPQAPKDRGYAPSLVALDQLRAFRTELRIKLGREVEGRESA